MHERTTERATDETQDTDTTVLRGSTVQVSRIEFSGGRWERVKGDLIREMPLTLFVNGNELVTILCTPSKLNCLVVGFLHLEGVISSLDEIALMRVCEEENLADVRLSRGEVPLPTRRTLTSGCGGGVALESDWDKLPEVLSSLSVDSGQVQTSIRKLLEAGEVYRRSGGVHTAALADASGLLVVAEDVGRHNTIDKIHGECLLTGIDSGRGMLLTTGRVSSEMLAKAAKMAVPVVVSRSAPTDRAVQIAQDKGITLIGYARGTRMSVYTHEWRVADCTGDS